MPAQHGGLVRSSPVTLAQRTGRTDIRPSVRHGRRPPHVASRSGKSPEAIPLGGDGIQPGSDHVLVDRRGQAETPSSVCRKALFYLFHDAMVLLDLTTPSEACETLSRDEFSGAVLCRLKNRFKPSDLESSKINGLLDVECPPAVGHIRPACYIGAGSFAARTERQTARSRNPRRRKYAA